MANIRQYAIPLPNVNGFKCCALEGGMVSTFYMGWDGITFGYIWQSKILEPFKQQRLERDLHKRLLSVVRQLNDVHVKWDKKITSYQTFTTNTGTRSMANIWDIYVYNSIQRLEEVFLRLMKPVSQMVSILMPYFPYQYYDLLDKWNSTTEYHFRGHFWLITCPKGTRSCN